MTRATTAKKTYFLPADEIHIWSASLLDHSKDIDYLKLILSQDEQDRARNFKFAKDQDNYITARGILRCLLSSYLEKAPQFIELVYGLWGKPCLLGEPPLHFSVSHSGNYALYAFSRQHEVGVDIEYINKDLDAASIVPTILSPFEKAYWDSAPLQERIQAFFRLWTRKEAYLKASGKGWLESQRATCVESITSFEENLEILPSPKNAVTYPYSFEPIPEYAAALFVKGPPLRVVYYHFQDTFKLMK